MDRFRNTWLLGLLVLLALAACQRAPGPDIRTTPAYPAVETPAPASASPQEQIQALTRQINAGENLPQAYVDRAALYMNLRYFPEAIADYNQAIATAPTAALYANRCVAYRVLSELSDAEADCQKAVELDANSLDARLALGALRIAQGRIDDARAAAQEAARIAPEAAEPVYLLSQVETEAGDFDAAVAALTRAIEIQPTNPVFYMDRGSLFIAQGKVDEARADMQSVLDNGNPAQHGQLLLQAGSIIRNLGATPEG